MISAVATAFLLAANASSNLSILCHPYNIAHDTSFFVTVGFSTPIPRPVDIHVDVLDPDTYAWISGDKIQAMGSSGNVTALLRVPFYSPSPLLGSVTLSERGQVYPKGVLATANFSLPMTHANQTLTPCPPIQNSATSDYNVEGEYVIIDSYEIDGAKVSMSVRYQILQNGRLGAALIWEANQTASGGVAVDIEKGNRTSTLSFPARGEAGGVYLVAHLLPTNGTWESRIAEDRIFT